MELKAKIIAGKYLDSVKLMLISKAMRELKGVIDAVAILATKENREILAATDMLVTEIQSAAESDIVIVIKADSISSAENALLSADSMINTPVGATIQDSDSITALSLESAIKALGTADLCLISVAGKYAAWEAEKALDLGLHVMLFSDNVSIEDELKLKQKALSQGLLMMGPDCGTAIINGVPLAFANEIPRGKIGIVSASGTGLQEISVGIAHRGCGISQAFGTGGRDGKAEIGALMLSACLDFLMHDENTDLIVLIAKTPDPSVQEMLWQQMIKSPKPIVLNYLKPIKLAPNPNIHYCTSLDGSAELACNIYNESKQIKKNDYQAAIPPLPLVSIKAGGERKYLRGLYSGGTLCYEALERYFSVFAAYPMTNLHRAEKEKLADSWKSSGDCFIDLGADEFTVGRPHPMIDYSLRLKKIASEAADPSTAVILLDVVLGYGAHPDPAAELIPVLQKIPPEIIVICHVLGTKNDPQNAEKQIEALSEAGALVFTSHAMAIDYTISIAQKLREQ